MLDHFGTPPKKTSTITAWLLLLVPSILGWQDVSWLANVTEHWQRQKDVD
jgi:hypothetical protein